MKLKFAVLSLVLAHGYADPAVYDNTTQMSRERDHLARQGYVVLLVDYRNHAGSSKDPDADANLRLGYAVDVINAAKANRLHILDNAQAEDILAQLAAGMDIIAGGKQEVSDIGRKHTGRVMPW